MFKLKFLIFITATFNLVSLSFCQQNRELQPYNWRQCSNSDWQQYENNKVNCQLRSVPLDLKDSQSRVG